MPVFFKGYYSFGWRTVLSAPKDQMYERMQPVEYSAGLNCFVSRLIVQIAAEDAVAFPERILRKSAKSSGEISLSCRFLRK
jgi:hypothetical protein